MISGERATQLEGRGLRDQADHIRPSTMRNAQLEGRGPRDQADSVRPSMMRNAQLVDLQP